MWPRSSLLWARKKLTSWPSEARDKAPVQASDIQPRTVPRHLAIIMDGNNRWARREGYPGVAGHRAGA
ncbi:MAG: hypothetical protein DBW90_04280, partial [Halieaceae bacterium]